MYSRVTMIQVQPDKMDELITVFRDSIVPTVKQQAGCQRVLLFTDAEAAKATSISIWENEAQWAESEKSGFVQQQLAKLAGILAGPPTREAYTLSVQAEVSSE